MQIEKLIEILEQSAPCALAEPWDNVGLLIEPEHRDIKRVLVALDCTSGVAEEAAKKGAQLVLTHHPLFYKPVQRMHYSAPETAAAYRLVRGGIGLFSAHTNLDSALGGVNDALAKRIGLEDVRALLHADEALHEGNASLGRVGDLPAPMTLRAFSLHVKERLNAAVRYAGEGEARVQRIAVLGGSGGDFSLQAQRAGAHTLVTGECKHSAALEALERGVCIVEAGHYETERLVLSPWIAGLQNKLEGLQYNVDFILSEQMKAPLIAP